MATLKSNAIITLNAAMMSLMRWTFGFVVIRYATRQDAWEVQCGVWGLVRAFGMSFALESMM